MRVVKKKPNQCYLFWVNDHEGHFVSLVCAESPEEALQLSKTENGSTEYLGTAKPGLKKEAILTMSQTELGE